MIIGVTISLLVQIFKKAYRKTHGSIPTEMILMFTVILAVLGAGVYSFLNAYNYLDTVMQVIATAGAFYAFIIRNIEIKTEE